MEMHNGSGQRITETYMIPVTGLNPHLTSTPALEEIGYMGNEVGPEFNFDQGLYYPAATDYYGYYCTGFESPGEWDDRHRFFSSDGQDPQYTTGLQTESSAYVYYTPSYEYAQSSYNPYNPYIPGAVIGFDGPYTGTQEYLANPSYHQPASSPAYFPVVLQPSSDFTPNSSSDPSLYNIGASVASRPDGAGLKYTIPLPSANAQAPSRRVVSGNPTLGSSQPSTHPVHQGAPLLHGLQANAAVSKQPPHGTSGGVPNGNQGTNSSGPMRATDHFSLARVTVPANNGFTNFGSKVHGWTTEDKLKPRFQFNQVLNNENGCTDVVLGERNKGPRTNRSKSQWRPEISVKAHTSKASASNTQGTIIIYADQFNRDDFPVNYQDAKFFVIKSYSEDDVHKSVKYNVWSSTPSGNKRLASAYEDAQRISTGKARKCPVFLFFSVNTSGQFCGVAEMIGPVDFHRDMDFWQQDKWTGSFPVKWHIVKDVPNSSFRHIMLENNENKPVTNSRDTQEITYIPGTNMLNIFKNSPLRTSILDDFVYYEERQRIMQQEKIRLFGRSYNTPLLSALVPNKPTGTVDEPSKAVGKQPDGTVDQPSKADGKQPNGTIDQPLNADGRPPNGTADHPVRADGKLIKPNGPKSQSDEQVSLKHGGTNPVDSKSTNPVDSKKDAKPADGNPTKSNDPKSSVMASLSDEQVSLKHDDTNPADYKKDANPADGKPTKPKGPKSSGKASLSEVQVSLKHDDTNPAAYKKDANPADGKPTKPNGPKSSGKASLSEDQVSLKHEGTNTSDYKKDAKPEPAEEKPTKPNGPKSSGKASLSDEKVSLKHDVTNPADYKMDAKPADGKPTKPNGPKSLGKASLSNEQVSLKHDVTNLADYRKDAKPADGKPTKPNGPKSSGKASLSDEQVSLKHGVTNPADYKKASKPADGKPTKPNGPKSFGNASLSEEQLSLKHDGTNPADRRKDAKSADGKPTKPNGSKSSGKASLSDVQVSLKHDGTNPVDYKKDAKANPVGDANGVNSIMRIGSLSFDTKEGDTNCSGTMVVESVQTDVVTVGSMPVKVNGFGESSSGILTFGTIPIDLQRTKT